MRMLKGKKGAGATSLLGPSILIPALLGIFTKSWVFLIIGVVFAIVFGVGAAFSFNNLINKLFANPFVTVGIIVGVVVVLRFMSGGKKK